MDTLTSLADEFYAFILTNDQHSRFWNGKLADLPVWDAFSPAAIEKRESALREFAARAEALEVPQDEKDIVLREAIAGIARSEIAYRRWDPVIRDVNPRMGLIENVMSFIDNFPLRTAEHGEDYLAMLANAPEALGVLGASVRESAEQGIVALASHLHGTADGIDKYLATPAGPEERLASQAPPADISAEDQAAWENNRTRLVVDTVRPALAAFAQTLHEVADAHGRPDDKPGLVHIDGGLDVYQGKIRGVTFTDHTPEQIHEIGLAKIAELEDEYREIAGPLFGTTDVAEIYARLRDDAALKYTSADAIIADAEVALERATAAAPEWFARVPKSPCRAVATDFGAMAYYSAPDPEVGKPGTFYFKSSEPDAWSTYELEAIVYHESIPGHHLQVALHVEDESLHPLMREYFNVAYGEGWGLYTERLADEMGLYTSQMARVGMLSADSLRAGRLVVDTGIHAMGWTREQAIQYFVDHSPMDRFHIEQEVDRYIGMPGQAVGYMIGRLEIQSIRAEAERRGGFDIREFHDQVLRNGSVPLPTLRRLVLG